MNVTVETATVYRARGRRWFTEAAAYRQAAMGQMLEEMDGCWCESAGPESGESICAFHSLLMDEPEKIAARAALLREQDLQS